MSPSMFHTPLLVLLVFIFHLGCTDANTKAGESIASKDAVEGDTIHLECRFTLHLDSNQKNSIFYWHRTNHLNTDPVAIGGNALAKDYQVDFDETQGKFDLTISRARYDRDNGQFECKIKEIGSGAEFMSRTYIVTILIPPGPPLITPTNPVAKEGEPYRLTCSSEGGSPDPVIQWHRDGVLLEGELVNGGTRSKPTSNTLVLNPTVDMDGASYTCTVWNRATKNERKQEAFVTLMVHYKPRIRVGPYDPLNVLNEGNAEMTCQVDANPPARSVKWMKGGFIIANSNNHTIIRVKPEDSGLYDCIADNSVGSAKESLKLTVLHGPQISLEPFKEAADGENVNIRCNVVSNPQPHTIVWSKENDAQFKQSGPVLTFNKITAEDIGNYFCKATATLKASNMASGIEKTSNASVQLQIRHKPGKTQISIPNPVVVAGSTFTLTCGANPPGYPPPEYEWWREGQESKKRKLGERANYTEVAVHVSDEGRYYCQPKNALGEGSVASLYLSVNQKPEMSIPMRPEFIAKDGDTNFKLMCIGKGKPRPQVSWTHNDVEINPESGEYRIENKEQNEDADVKTITTTLYFEAMARKGANSISANDRGTYACHFDNGIDKAAKSETVLRVQHTPQVRHTYNRVAFDVGEMAVLQCKMSAFPAPKFEWYFPSAKLLETFGDRYTSNSTELPDDVHLGTLAIRSTRDSDYGDYTCRASNSAGDDDEKTIIKLVKKSPPETPVQLEVLEVVSDSAILRWVEGFNGGFSNTEFVVNYNDGEKSRNESCRAMNPCKITGLESRHEYQFRVLAVNPRGFSQYSEPLKIVTKVNLKDMPSAFDSSYDRERNSLVFRVEPNDVSLRLIGKVEVRSEATQQWTQLAVVDVLSDLENVYLKYTSAQITDIRIILCLKSNDSWCGYEHLVKMDSAYTREAKAMAADHLLGVIIISSICAFVGVIFILCCCWKKKNEKPEKKDFESDTSNERPNKTLGQNYYSSHDNKGLMSDMDSANMNKLASGIYGSNLGPMNGHIPQNYYLTGDGNGDPSPNGSNETAQTEFWNSMKSNIHLHDNLNESELNYNAGYNMMNGQLMEPNGYLNSYSYYPTQGYQPLDEDNLSRKNNLNMYYDEMNGNAYGGAMPIDMMTSETLKANQHIAYNGGDDVDYPTNRTRVMSEIIV